MKPVLNPEQTDLRAHRLNAQVTDSLSKAGGEDDQHTGPAQYMSQQPCSLTLFPGLSFQLREATAGRQGGRQSCHLS